jgi:hypothetical protein
MPPAQQSGAGVPFAGVQGDFFALQQFGGINTKASRNAIDDNEFGWLENMMPIGDGNLRAVGTNGSTLYTAAAGKTIIQLFFYNIGSTTYVAVFLSDGTAYQVNTSTAGVTTISASANTFYNGTSVPAAAQWGDSGILIVGVVTGSDYWAWDGTTLFAHGSASPSWLNGGTPTTMPTGIQGTCIETYQARVWIGNGSTITFSGPSNGASFSGSIGGGAFTSSDSFLRQAYNAIRQANGFLYIFGDSSINVISNVQTSGSPLATTFNNQNVDPQVGTAWPNTVQAYGRGLVFANQAGVFALYGGSAEKVSDKLDGIFLAAQQQLASASPLPSAALALIFSIRVYMIAMPVQDPVTGQFRTAVCIWDGKKWFIGSQDNTISIVAPQEINSVLDAWGTDGSIVYPMFTGLSTTLKKYIYTKMWAGTAWTIIKQTLRSYMQLIDNEGTGATVTGTIQYLCSTEMPTPGLNQVAVTYTASGLVLTFLGAGNVVLQFQGAGSQNINFTSMLGQTATGVDCPGSGILVGANLTSTSEDFTIIAYAILYRNQSAMGG